MLIGATITMQTLTKKVRFQANLVAFKIRKLNINILELEILGNRNVNFN